MRKSTRYSHTPPSTPPRLFSGLTADQEKLVLESAQRRKFRAQRVIIRAGDLATRLCLLTRGRARFHRVTKEGEEVVFWWLTQGDAFGIATLAGPEHYIGTAQAVDDCEVLIWPLERIRSLGPAKELLVQNALHFATHYMSVYTDRIVGLVTRTAEQRLADTLIRLGHEIGHERHGAVELEIMNEDLARLANVSVFTASRQLKEWERKRILKKSRGKTSIISPTHLLID